MGQRPTGCANPIPPTGIRPCLLPTSAPHGCSGPAIPYRYTGYRASGGGRPGNEVAFRTPSAPRFLHFSKSRNESLKHGRKNSTTRKHFIKRSPGRMSHSTPRPREQARGHTIPPGLTTQGASHPQFIASPTSWRANGLWTGTLHLAKVPRNFVSCRYSFTST